MKNWEIIADNLSQAGWSYGYVSALDSNGRRIWIANAHRGDGKPNTMCRPKAAPAWSNEPEPGHNRDDDLPADDTQLPSVGL
jgi:hypothetical protein